MRKKRKAAKRCRPRQSVTPAQHLEVISVASTTQRDDESDVVLVEEIPSPSSTLGTSSSDSRVLDREKAATREMPPKTISASERLKNDCHLFGQKVRQPFLHVPLQWQSPERSKRRLSKTTPISTRVSTIPSEESTKPDNSALWGSDSVDKPGSRDHCDDLPDESPVLDEYYVKEGLAVDDVDGDGDGDERCIKKGPESKIKARPHRRKRARLISVSSSSSSQSRNSEPSFVPRREPKRASRKSLMVSSGARRIKDRDLKSDRTALLRSSSKAEVHRKSRPPVRSGSSVEICADETCSTFKTTYYDKSSKLHASTPCVENRKGIKRSQTRSLTNSKSDLYDTKSKDAPVPIHIPGVRRCKRHSKISEPEDTPMSYEDQYLSEGNQFSAPSDEKALDIQGNNERHVQPVHPEGKTDSIVLIEADNTEHVIDYVLTVSSDSDPSESTPKVGFRSNLRGSLSRSSSCSDGGQDQDLRISALSDDDEEEDRLESSEICLSRVFLKLRIKEPCDEENQGSSSQQTDATRSCGKNRSTDTISRPRPCLQPRPSRRLGLDRDVMPRNGKTNLRSSSRQKVHKSKQFTEVKQRRNFRLWSNESTDVRPANMSRCPLVLGRRSEDTKTRENPREVRNKLGSRKRGASPANDSTCEPNMGSRRLSCLRSSQSTSSASESGDTWEKLSSSPIALKNVDGSGSDPGKSSSKVSSPVSKSRRSTKKKPPPGGSARSSWTKKVSPSRATRRRNAENTDLLTGKRKTINQRTASPGYKDAQEEQQPAAKKRKVERDPTSAEKPEQVPRKVLGSISVRQCVSMKSGAKGSGGNSECVALSRNAASRGSPIRNSRRALQKMGSVRQEYHDEKRTPKPDDECEDKDTRRKPGSGAVNGTARSSFGGCFSKRRTSPRLTRQTVSLRCRRCGSRLKSLCACRVCRS